HTSVLPKYRGASPIQTAIASGERETGVTLMRIVKKLDAGPVADVERVAIDPLDTAADIERKLSASCVPLLARALPKLRDGTLAFIPQDEGSATYCRRLEKADGTLEFTQPAAVLAARINGLFPWPACTVSLAGQDVKLGSADVLPGAGNPGEVIGSDETGLKIGTAEGVLRVRRLQRPGGRMLPAREFLLGFSAPIGTTLASRPMTPLVANAPFRR
ncbi:MAG: methionyl-tRNA formyltransferase, partial [Verrucomicrobia bacterium]|nr:methionyl-tRNA formyltransferase [Verrucomicrobiota bacterium]